MRKLLAPKSINDYQHFTNEDELQFPEEYLRLLKEFIFGYFIYTPLIIGLEDPVFKKADHDSAANAVAQ